MIDRDSVWTSVDDALAAIGFLFVLFPAFAVATASVDSSGPRVWVAMVLLSAVAGTTYRRRGFDIGDLGSFILAASIAIIPVALLVNAFSLFSGLEIAFEREYAVMVACAYAVAFWYAYRGGRERVRGRASEQSTESA